MARILSAAEEEFKAAGFSGATTAAIARRADVTEAQLFRYFATKSDLFREAIFTPLNQHFMKFMAEQTASGADLPSRRDRVRQYITELQDFLSDHSRMFMSLIVAQTYATDTTQGISGIGSLLAYFERGATSMTERIRGEPKVDPQLMVRVSFAAVLANVMFKDWLFPAHHSPSDIREAVVDFVLDGINAGDHGPADD